MIASAQARARRRYARTIEALAVQYPDVPVYSVHDLDRDGIVSAGALGGKDTKSYRWKTQPNVINLGLSLEDVRRFGVEDESVSGKSKEEPASSFSKMPVARGTAIEYLSSGARRYRKAVAPSSTG